MEEQNQVKRAERMLLLNENEPWCQGGKAVFIRRAANIKSLKLKLSKIDVNSERVALQLCRVSTPTRKIYLFMYRSSRVLRHTN